MRNLQIKHYPPTSRISSDLLIMISLESVDPFHFTLDRCGKMPLYRLPRIDLSLSSALQIKCQVRSLMSRRSCQAFVRAIKAGKCNSLSRIFKRGFVLRCYQIQSGKWGVSRKIWQIYVVHPRQMIRCSRWCGCFWSENGRPSAHCSQ